MLSTVHTQPFEGSAAPAPAPRRLSQLCFDSCPCPCPHVQFHAPLHLSPHRALLQPRHRPRPGQSSAVDPSPPLRSAAPLHVRSERSELPVRRHCGHLPVPSLLHRDRQRPTFAATFTPALGAVPRVLTTSPPTRALQHPHHRSNSNSNAIPRQLRHLLLCAPRRGSYRAQRHLRTSGACLGSEHSTPRRPSPGTSSPSPHLSAERRSTRPPRRSC